MSVAEMKALAIEKLSALQSEAEIKEILDHLKKIETKPNECINADVFFKKAVENYDDVLIKLAQ